MAALDVGEIADLEPTGGRHDETLASARGLLGPLYKLHCFKSVLDVGCGVGTWLTVCRELGAARIQGLEGLRADPARSRIGTDMMLSDLEAPMPDVGRFDLAMSLEVGEHLSPGRAETFVAELAARADTVLFGAAIPGQGGAGHRNEQWQSYWVDLFRSNGLQPADTLRWLTWQDRDLKIWYRQNTLLYVGRDSPLAHLGRSDVGSGVYDVVHPEMFDSRRKKTRQERAFESPTVNLEVVPPPTTPTGLTLDKNDRSILIRVAAAVAAGTPLSYVRLSHCEGKMLVYPKIRRSEIDRTLLRQWGYKDVDDAAILDLSEQMKEAVRLADIIGLPEIKPEQMDQIATNDGLRYWNYARTVVIEGCLVSEGASIVHLSANGVLIRSGLLDELRESGVGVGLVGCRDLRGVFSDLGFDDVIHIPVPEAARTRGDAKVEPHYPNAFDRILRTIAEQHGRRVYFVGAGILGKIYCAAIKRQGSIALDIGSIMDLWAGVPSRSGHTVATLEAWRLDRQIPAFAAGA